MIIDRRKKNGDDLVCVTGFLLGFPVLLFLAKTLSTNIVKKQMERWWIYLILIGDWSIDKLIIKKGWKKWGDVRGRKWKSTNVTSCVFLFGDEEKKRDIVLFLMAYTLTS